MIGGRLPLNSFGLLVLSDVTPFVALAVTLLISSTVGIRPVRKLIEVREAKHELKHGSAGFIRTTSGWFVIVLWLAASWFVASVLGDWWATGDLEGAIDRGWLRLQVLFEILAALSEE